MSNLLRAVGYAIRFRLRTADNHHEQLVGADQAHITDELFGFINVPNGVWIEDMGLSNDLFVDPVPVINGMITAPERPGHGLAFRPEILRDFRI